MSRIIDRIDLGSVESATHNTPNIVSLIDPCEVYNINDMTLLQRLRLLENADRAYWIDNDPILSDTAYDTLVASMENRGELTIDYAYTTTHLNSRMTHANPMHSLIRGYDIDAVEKWLKYLRSKGVRDVTMSLKIDGIAFSARYRKGKLLQASTRGTGIVGEDITAKLVAMGTIPTNVDPLISGEVRGELYVSPCDFIEINKTRLKPFKSERHAAAGILAKGEGVLKATLYYTDIVGDYGNSDVDSMREDLAIELNVSVLPIVKGIKDPISSLETMRDELLADGNGEFPYDGIVLTVSNIDDRSKVQGSNWYKPRHSFAYKLPSARTEAMIQGTGYSIGADGKLIPKAYFDTVQVGVLSVKELSLYNEDIRDLYNYYVGKKVIIELTGDTVVTIKPLAGSLAVVPTILKNCPYCNSSVVRKGSYYNCSKPETCDAVIIVNLVRFFSRKGLNCKGLGSSMLKRFISIGCKTPDDIYKIDNSTIKNWPNGNNIITSLTLSKNATVAQILYGMNIPGVGQTSLMKAGGVKQALDAATHDHLNTLKELRNVGFTALNELNLEQ